MRKLYEDTDLIDEINKMHDINFIAYAVTPWQAHGIDCKWKQFRDLGIVLRGIVVITTAEANSTDFLISEKNFTQSQGHEIVFRYKMIRPAQHYVSLFLKQLHYCLWKEESSENVIYVLNPRVPNYEIARKIKKAKQDVSICHVVIDEGLATYMGQAGKFSLLDKQSYLPMMKRSMNRIMTWMIYARKTNVMIDTLFLGNIRHLKLNMPVALRYRRLFEERHPQGDYRHFEGAVVIITQPFTELNEVKNNEDLLIITQMVRLLNKADIPVVIKPHPREKQAKKYESLNCKIESDYHNSLEEIIGALKIPPRAVLGFTSTSLVTMSALFDIPSISLCNLLSKNNTTQQLAKVIRQFKRGFSKQVTIVTDLEEAMNAI